ncbi:glycoside hydrolase family 38 C-terminal domain-containing protein [Microbulbifer guangxiensis]|uniref:glycoside hydrolase family 38 N-terminal domain-containing protein n=1 Tax=Microbulbifer guangxiensis TaxID=2904249 RepID=UPI001F39E911|nr:glycoside hydrolase family 38 C-terminal domain-containing protein [Microbulbifer guangxiensis]
MTKNVAIVVQTHWDREWYYPHQTFLGRLLQVMEQVVEQLDSGQLACFLFDGQVSAIEDFYREAEPALAERVRVHVAANRIVIGPWYIMADEFLCSGESLVRNLELGIRRANQHGHCQRVGYLPDTFGHISQMPQLLRGFGIDNAVAWRGIDAECSELSWQAPDGSSVFTVFLTEGYYQHPFNTADWQQNLTAYLEKIGSRSRGRELLLTQGGDHLLSDPQLQQRIDTFNAGQDDYRLAQSTLAEHIEHLQSSTPELESIEGELRGNQRAFVLPDVLSTRQYLKAQNQQLEDTLTGLIEPLLAMVPMENYPSRYLEQTWQLLIEQHAHDSICGCSVDAVHREMETRFDQLQQRLNTLCQRAQSSAGMINQRLAASRNVGLPSPFADDSRFSLLNPSPKFFNGWVTQILFLAGERADTLAIADTQGNTLESVILNSEPAQEFHSPLDDFPDMVPGHRYTVAIRAELAGIALLPCVVEKQGGVRSTDILSADMIENEFYRVSVGDDRVLVIEDKSSGRRYVDTLALVSETDAGDTYNFSPLDSTRYRAQIGQVQSRQLAGGISEMQLQLTLQQPSGLTDDRRAVTAEQVGSSGTLRIRLLPDDDLLHCTLHWHNRACDQRLRLTLPLLETIEHTAADSAFDWVERPKQYAIPIQAQGQQEAPVSVMPSHSAIKAGQIGFVHRGLQEFEVLEAESQDLLGVTLVRSVGWLSRRDLKTRGLGAGPDLATPGAQCLRAHRFEFALTLRNPDPVTLLNRAADFRKPVTALRGHADRLLSGAQLDNPELQVSSVRRIASGMEIRLWNPTETSVEARFDCAVTRTDLAGATVAPSLRVGPKQIATFVAALTTQSPEEGAHG